jgi:hypothetical protein
MTKKIPDRDLMLLHDGELDGEELERLERALEEDERARGKLSALRLTGSLLRESVEADTRADDIASAVMAKLDEADRGEPEELPVLEQPKVPLGRPAANDNARTLWSLAAAAAAVAAGLFVWGSFSAPNDSAMAVAPHSEPVAEVASEHVEALQPTAQRPAIGAAASKADDEDAVEIARLDFGAHTGSVFKVRDENTGASTAVVWVTSSGDDE